MKHEYSLQVEVEDNGVDVIATNITTGHVQQTYYHYDDDDNKKACEIGQMIMSLIDDEICDRFNGYDDDDDDDDEEDWEE